MKVITIATALFAAIAMAKKHHFCQCCVNGKVDAALTTGACGEWCASHPNSKYDDGKKSCADPGRGRGISGQPWEDTCRSWGTAHGYTFGQIQGCC